MALNSVTFSSCYISAVLTPTNSIKIHFDKYIKLFEMLIATIVSLTKTSCVS